MARTRAIYDWVFGLSTGPDRKQPSYEVRYDAVDDIGALPPRALRSRRAREAESLRTFTDGPLPKIGRLDDLHRWLNLKHSGYSYAGQLSKRPFNKSSGLAQSY